MFDPTLPSPCIVLDNEDTSLDTFLKLLIKHNKISSPQLRCRRTIPQVTLGNKIKKFQIQFTPHQGQYLCQHNQNHFKIVLQHKQAKITTQCRKIQYLKKLTIYGQHIDKVKEFVLEMFELMNDQQNQDLITVYENNNGSWRMSKQKQPRKLQSVILKEDLVEAVLEDINEFIGLEQWYKEMGIPYKRSYLFYGPPGTGKSSFAQALAGRIKFSICFVNCSDKINDYNFNYLLNIAPKKSVILVEDVDAIFTQRKNSQKVNSLTFSGFLNAIDGVRSQQGRIIIMTTNFKQKLDPALLRPGRIDQSYEITLASTYQIQKLCYRFFKDNQLAKNFAQLLPQGKFSMSMIQGYLLNHRKHSGDILKCIDQLLQSDQNVKIDQFLTEINCLECLNAFRMEQCYTLAAAKNLAMTELERIAEKLSPVLKGRLLETVRADRKHYLKSGQALQKFIDESTDDQQVQRKVKKYVKDENINTFYLVKDKIKELTKDKDKDHEPK